MSTPGKKSIYVIINPVSGTKSKKNIPLKINETLDEHDIKILETQHEGHATEFAREAVRNNIDYVIAVGGDGTVNEVAKGLINTDVILGIIPSGSGNGLARDLYIPMNHSKAVKILQEGVVAKIDYGIANDNVFFCTCGVGFDAKVSEMAVSKEKRGVLMYAKNIFEIFNNFTPEKYKVTCDEGVFEGEAFVVTCANASQYGNNAFIAPHADIQDGKMNISILKPITALDVPQTAIQMFSKNLSNNDKLIEMLTTEAVIEREKEGMMHLDGNAIHTDKDIHVKIVKQGLNVLVPSEIPKVTADVQSFITNLTRWI